MKEKDKNTSSESEHREPKKSKKRRGRRILRNTLISLGVLIVAGTGLGAYEYHQLQPATHFQDLKPITPVHNTTGSNAPNPMAWLANVPKEQNAVFNMLLIGSDARPGQKASHSDSMVLIHLNLNTHTYNLLSLPRDTRVYMPGYGYTKLTSVQFMYQVNDGTKQGIINAVAAISKYTGVPINFYAETNYRGLQDIVNALGGINMNVPFKVTINHAWYKQDNGKIVTKGTHFLDGKMVTELVHVRDGLPGTDYGRQRLQEEALIGIAKAILQPSNLTKLPALAKALPKFLVATNMSTQDMLSLAVGVHSDFHPHSQIHYRQIQGTPEYVYNDILQAKDDEIVLNPGQLKSVVQHYFTK